MSMEGVVDVTAAGEPAELQRNAVGLPGVLMQALTDVAPAIAVLFTVQFTASQAGLSMPAAYVGAFVVAIPIALVLCPLARKLPSAGGWYTYVSRGLHPRAGFLVAWLYFLYAPLQTAITGTSLGTAFSSTIQAEYGISFPWWVFMLALIVFVVVMAYRGISFSARAIVILGLAELAIVGIFSVWGFFQSGPGGVTLQVFNPANAPTGAGQGFGLAVVFAIFALNGWDGAVPLAEESRDPKRVVPRAVFLALVVMGFFLVICAWGIMSGWGVSNITGFAKSSEALALIPVFILGAIACYRLYRREYRGEFNWFLHVASPVVTIVALLAVGYYSLNPAPVFPYNWALPICGAWLVLGIAVLVAMRARGHESWLASAGDAMIDRPVGEEAPRPGGTA